MMGKLVSQQQLMDEKIYVAVGRDLGKKSTLVWALLNTGGKEFCIVHVHQPLYRKDKEKVQKILDKYLEICSRMQVRAEKIHIEMETVEKGIIQLISERNVKKLVMGAASDRHYSMRMADLLSIKAIFIRQEAPATCCIWFTCKGYLVYKREAMMGNASTSSDQHSVRSRVSVTPSGRFKIPSGYGNEDDEMYQLAFSEADKWKKEAHLEAFKHQEAEKEKSEAIKRVMEDSVSSRILEEKIYVAVGRNVSKNSSNLIWALQNFEGNKICILHIPQSSPMIPVLGTKFDASTADEELVRVYRGKEKAKTDKILQDYLSICLSKRVQAEKLCIEMDSVEKGIVETIHQYRIRKFVMGAAADKHYSMKMEDLKSKKANFVCEQAPVTCQLYFTCKGNLIHTREARMDDVRSLSVLLSEFQRLVLPQISTCPLQEVASLNEQNKRESSSDISSCQSADTFSHPARSLILAQEELNDSSSQVFVRNDKLLNQLHQVMAEANNPKP